MSYDPHRDKRHANLGDEEDSPRDHHEISVHDKPHTYDDEDDAPVTFEMSKPLKHRNLFKWVSHLKALIVTIVLLILMAILIIVSGYFFLEETKCTSVAQSVHAFATVSATTQLNNIKKKNYNHAEQINYLTQHVLPPLFELSEVMNEIYLTQVWEHNEKVLAHVQKSFKKKCDGEIVEMYELNAGPWDRLNNESYFLAPYVPNLSTVAGAQITSTNKPKGANFYPSDITVGEFNQYVQGLQSESQEYKNALGYYHVIRREDGKLKPVPYSVEYKEHLEKAATILTEVAEKLKSQPESEKLVEFLEARAQAFRSNDYEESDIAWLDVTDQNSLLEVTVGPYETYEDKLKGLKSAFEIYVGIRDLYESNKVQKITNLLPQLSRVLPLDDAFRQQAVVSTNMSRVIRVVDQVMNGGEARTSVQTAAYNLPNSPKVTAKHGSKRVLLKNIQQAKYENTLYPISNLVTGKLQKPYLHFDAFFTHVMAHEIMHGLGPQFVYEDLTATNKSIEELKPVNQALEELYSTIEEAKADVGGLWMLTYLLNNKLVDLKFNFTKNVHDLEEKYGFSEQDLVKRSVFTTFVANVFRSVRFGDDAHAIASKIIFNFFKRRNAVTIERESPDSSEEEHVASETAEVVRVNINFASIEGAAETLTRQLMTIQANGDKAAAHDFINEYGNDSEDIRLIVEQISEVEANSIHKIPVDVRVVYDKKIYQQ